MPRKPRIHYPGALYHVITRGNNRQQIYHSEEDYQVFKEQLKTIKERLPFYLYAYCLMPNHIHLLIEVKKDPLAVIVQRLLTRYTKYYNRTNKKRGHLFQGRYKAILCEKDSYLLELVRYIHLNPLRAKLVNSPSKWEWSGHREYINASKEDIVDQETVLKYFSENKSKARTFYEEFVRGRAGESSRKDFYPAEKVPFLGNDEYIEQHMMMHLDMIEKKTPGVVNVNLRNNFIEILKKVCSGNDVKPEMVQGASRSDAVAEKRKDFVIEAYKCGHKAADIARYINRDPSFVSRLIDRFDSLG